MLKHFYFLFIFTAVFLPATSHATCINPVGDHGDMLYNLDHTVMQYCNGTNWISMDASRSGGADNLGNHIATKDLDLANFKAKNAAIPTSSADLTNKAYVDAAVASAAGSGGGGGGATCYYIFTNAACGTGFSEMPGTMAFYTGSTAKACCTISTSSSVTDDSPAPFDFPDVPNYIGTAAHTWAPIQITDFDTASVQVSATANAGTPEYRICADDSCNNVIKAWRSTSTGIANGNYLQIRIGEGTRPLWSNNNTITVTVGAMSDSARIYSSRFGVFASSQTYNGILGGVAGADSKCQGLATAAGLTGTWRAWVSDTTATSAPATRFENKGTGTAFIKYDGTVVANNWADLIDSTLSTPINLTETGGSLPSSNIWTSTSYNGTYMSTAPSHSCSSWTLSSNTAYYGTASTSNPSWSQYSTANCTTLMSLYCFQTKF